MVCIASLLNVHTLSFHNSCMQLCVCVLVFVYKKIFFEFAVHFSNDESESVDSTTFFLVYHPKV